MYRAGIAVTDLVFDGMTEDEAWVAVDQEFPLDGAAWRDVMKQQPPVRDGLIRDMLTLGGLSWTKKPGAIDIVMSALNFLAAIANPVTAITGGATGLVSLAAALKSL